MASYDSWFTFLCAPNDTHNCGESFVKNGVVIYLGPSYGYGKSEDVTATKLLTAGTRAAVRKGWRSSGEFMVRAA